MAPPARPRVVIGLDVGKSAHWACVVTREGGLLASRPIPNRENAIDGLYAQYPGALVVVDQVRNIGSLALSRAKLAGMPRAYLPGLAAQRDFLTCENTRSKNRLRSILLESCPEFEAQADLSDPATLKLMAAVGGPWSISEASPQSVGALTRGCRRAKVAALAGSVESSSRPHPAAVACEDRAVRLLARRISENDAEIGSLTSEISALLSADETHRCLLTVPGIGPRTASELVISIDIADFPSHDRLASRCGLAPRNRRSGTSISSVSASRQGNKRLKNLLIFSCNCLARSRNRWGEYYARCRDRGMPHGKALKAVARKRLKVIYAVMRDKVPYAA